MKYLILPVLAATLCFTACNTQDTNDTDANTTETHSGMDHNGNPTTTATGAIDPVCEMAADATWTNYSVHAGDTVRFCSEGCKSAFDARPEKYAANIRK